MTNRAANYAVGCFSALVAAVALVGATFLSALASEDFDVSIVLPVVLMLVLLGLAGLGLLANTESRPRAVAWGIAAGALAGGALLLVTWFG